LLILVLCLSLATAWSLAQADPDENVKEPGDAANVSESVESEESPESPEATAASAREDDEGTLAAPVDGKTILRLKEGLRAKQRRAPRFRAPVPPRPPVVSPLFEGSDRDEADEDESRRAEGRLKVADKFNPAFSEEAGSQLEEALRNAKREIYKRFQEREAQMQDLDAARAEADAQFRQQLQKIQSEIKELEALRARANAEAEMRLANEKLAKLRQGAVGSREGVTTSEISVHHRHEQADLHAELQAAVRDLRAEIKALRDEVAELREKVEAR
jgi:hypothetical protein